MKVNEIYCLYDVLILHSTKLNGGAGVNKCIKQDASVPERIEAVIDTSTYISCSSFKSGDRLSNIVGPVGLFLKDGSVKAADRFDLGSEINEDCDRVCDQPPYPIEVQVERAIMERTAWNEFLICNHEEFGIYLCFDEPNYLYEQLKGYRNFYIASLKFNLPYFIIENGILYKSEFDIITDTFIKKSSLTIREIKMEYCGIK
jgi:hypothetical protein